MRCFILLLTTKWPNVLFHSTLENQSISVWLKYFPKTFAEQIYCLFSILLLKKEVMLKFHWAMSIRLHCFSCKIQMWKAVKLYGWDHVLIRIGSDVSYDKPSALRIHGVLMPRCRREKFLSLLKKEQCQCKGVSCSVGKFWFWLVFTVTYITETILLSIRLLSTKLCVLILFIIWPIQYI